MIAVGQRIPEVTLRRMSGGRIEEVGTGELFGGKRAVLFAVPGAFTPTCSDDHLPGFLARSDEIRARGVDLIACTGVNDPWVMDAWGRAAGVGDSIVMLADGNGDLARALGLAFDGSGAGLGVRSRRYAAVIDDGLVTHLGVEPARGVGVSGAEAILAALG
jgi:glutaredoxin/glutathione-dependent peroxiredoxin